MKTLFNRTFPIIINLIIILSIATLGAGINAQSYSEIEHIDVNQDGKAVEEKPFFTTNPEQDNQLPDTLSQFDSVEDYLEWMFPERNTSEYFERLKKKNIEMHELFVKQQQNKGLMSQFEHLLNIPRFKQENKYYCVPASCKNVIHAINGTSPSQSTLAGNMGTNTNSNDNIPDGTTASAARAELIQQTGLNYEIGIIDTQPFYQPFTIDINAGCPVVFFVWYDSYDGYPRHVAHAIVGYGYDTQYTTVCCFDVAGRFGTGNPPDKWNTVSMINQSAFYYIY